MRIDWQMAETAELAKIFLLANAFCWRKLYEVATRHKKLKQGLHQILAFVSQEMLVIVVGS